VALGLHGHRIGDNVIHSFTVELIGTFVLVLAIISTAIAATLAQAVAGAPFRSLAVPMAGGFALVVVVASFGHISGAHVNLAVTIGLALNRRSLGRLVVAYLSAQFAGSILAALTAWVLFGGNGRLAAGLGATVPAAIGDSTIKSQLRKPPSKIQDRVSMTVLGLFSRSRYLCV
jgi:glycerol uptake facilitator-like aquaporin